ncbi:MAG: PKD domain-containing protein, partial [Saprospiraceae bacterium]|nr:PKD domain-containing protein [Saprospiraceae bacterium]
NDWLCTDGGDGTMGFVNPGLDRQVYSQYDIKTLKSNRTISPVTRAFNNKPNNTYITGASSDLLIHPAYYGHWLSGSGTKLYQTKDNGLTFVQLYDFGANLAAMDQCWSNPNVIYACTFPDWWGLKRIYRSDNGGTVWTEITPSSGMVNGNTWIPYDIAVDHTDPMKVWITRTSMYDSNINGYSVYYSSNGGSTWQNISGSGLNGHSPTGFFLQKGTNGGLYIGTRRGVFYKNQTMPDWVIFNQGLPSMTHSTRMEGYYRTQKLRNATNRSVWESEFYENSIPLAFPSVNTDKIYCDRDTAYFVDHSVVSDQGVTWLWSFPGGIPSTSTIRNPKVSYTTSGNYDVTLTVTDNFGTSTRTITNMIMVDNLCQLDTIPGKSLLLSASTDYAVIPPLNITTNTLTISCWLKPNGTQVTNAGLVFSGSGGACGINVKSNNQLGYHWADSPGSYNWNGGPTLPSNVWSHVALVITPTSATIYLNGVAYTRVATHASVIFDTDFRLGRDRTNSSRNFVGQIDEVSIYNQSMTLNDIRLLRHLTRKAGNNLVSYFQFNENSGTAFDKIGVLHATLFGGASRTNSTAALGGGKSASLLVNSGGLKHFGEADLNMYFPVGGSYPNGDVVVTKINQLPDQIPDTYYPPDAYWIVNNYGTNSTFTTLDSIQFFNSGNISGGCDVNFYEYYKRATSAEGNSWGTAMDIAESYNPYPPSRVSFGAGNGVNGFSQFIVVRNNKDGNVNATEVCNGIDDDCDGLIDEVYSLLVSNAMDNGENTLRAILNCAQHGDTIRFASNIDTITLLTPFSIQKRLVLMDQNGNNVVIRSNLNSSGFMSSTFAILIDQEGDISCHNINFIQANNSLDKPLLLNEGKLTLTNCKLSGNPDTVIKNQSGAIFEAAGVVELDK